MMGLSRPHRAQARVDCRRRLRAVFGGSIVPQEVEAMLAREADAGARGVLGDRILAPNDYVITLSVPDYQKVSADPDLTSTTFAKHLEDTSMSRDGKRMVMWSSDSSVTEPAHRTVSRAWCGQPRY